MLEGQGMDLHSTFLTECPKEYEYLQMVDRSKTHAPSRISPTFANLNVETGGLFQILYDLMRAESQETA